MLNQLMDTILSDSSITGMTVSLFLLSLLAALIIGVILAAAFTFRGNTSHSLFVTLALLPSVVSVVIMMVSGSLGASVAVAGTFSLVRFRSVPGTAREICGLFVAMATGLAVGMGYLGVAAMFALIMSAMILLYTAIGFDGTRALEQYKDLNITIPEDLDFGGVFDDIFDEFTDKYTLLRVKTTNLGSLCRLSYRIKLKDPSQEKQLIDQLRCRNGNLEISLSVAQTDLPEL